MKRTVWITPAALVLAGSGLATVPSSQAATVTVSIDNMSFVGGPRTVVQGTTVSWTFDDDTAHTTTSDQGFWASPQRSSGQYAAVFRSAGTFAYHCVPHPHMTSRIIVPLKASGIPGGKRVRWASAATTGRNYDIKVKKPGATKFVAFRSATSALAKNFTPKKKGKYIFKARTRNLANGKASGWSPAKAVRIR